MKLLHLADLHGNPHQYSWLASQASSGRFGAVVLAGDLVDDADEATMRGQIALVRLALDSLPAGLPVLLCSGNHDYERGDAVLETPRWMRKLRRPGLYLDGDSPSIDGVRYHCIGWGNTPLLFGATDWVVCHCPPGGVRTAVIAGQSETGFDDDEAVSDFGDTFLAETIAGSRLTLLGGHVHRARHWRDATCGYRSFNPCNNPRLSIPAHIIHDTATGRAVRVEAGG